MLGKRRTNWTAPRLIRLAAITDEVGCRAYGSWQKITDIYNAGRDKDEPERTLNGTKRAFYRFGRQYAVIETKSIKKRRLVTQEVPHALDSYLRGSVG